MLLQAFALRSCNFHIPTPRSAILPAAATFTSNCRTRRLQRGARTPAAMAPNVFNPGGEDAADAGDSLPFISRRSPVLGKRGMVACSQPLAAEVRRHS